ncbi:sialidase family protein [Tichowtungia aerotolerans]|uniref:LamG-like jellyroll fold domain-containing protein n=1 Tax=Tichowtungia aerotolerans TaxID=2697043 RepID=A0A6P1M4X3_9BACT|nr:sialidase family protein [Tichowtungia aerotolerans]QHI69102.1 hypothetical protein GT409_06460 [Tichowtungia aerotolerans]
MLITVLLATSSARGSLLVHDNFNYAANTVVAPGETLGSAADGFSNPWKFSGYSGEVVAGLEFPGVESSGNALKVCYEGAGYLFRGMASSLSAGTYYMSMIFFRDDADDGGGENWRWELRHAGSYASGPISSIKTSLGSTSGEQVNLQVAGDVFQVGVATYKPGTPVFMLAKIAIDDFGAETASMKWYRFGEPLPVVESGIVWDATGIGEFTGGSGWNFVLNSNIPEITIDEFRLGTELSDVIPVSPLNLPPAHPSFQHVFNYTAHYQIYNDESSPRYLTADNAAGYADGSPIKLSDANGQLTQRWVLDAFPDGQSRIRSFNAPYFVRANAEDGGWNSGDPVQLHSWMDWSSQKWTLIPQDDGHVSFKIAPNDFYMSAEAVSNDAPIELDSWQDESRQKWVLDIQDTIQSPYILRAADGNLLAFFRYSTPIASNQGLLYTSLDDGRTWSLKTAFAQDIYGPTLFVLNNDLYMLYVSMEDNTKLQLKKSADHGASWSNHVLAEFPDGVETSGGADVLIKDGILYYGFADRGGPGGWPSQYRLRVASCSVSSDLISASSWKVTAPLEFPSSPAVSGTRNGWLEANCVAGPDGRVWVVARVDKVSGGDVAAVLKVAADRTALEFNNQYPAPGNETGFIYAPWAGSSKFHFVYDDVSSRYLVMCNPYLGAPPSSSSHPYVRNILALYETTDLKNYQLVKTLVDDDSFEDWNQSSLRTGFQYPVFIIDGESLKYVVRTAYRSFDNYHDANMGTYHELENFREYLSPDGELAYYRFDAPNEPGLDSSKMKGNFSDVVGAEYAPNGKYGGCLLFDGVDDGLGLMHRVSPKLHRSKQVSVSVWIKNNTGSGPVFTSAIDGAFAGLALQVLYGKLQMTARSLSSDALQAREFAYPSTGQWHHVVALWDFENSTMRLWLDNVEQAGNGTVVFGSGEYTRGAPAYQDAIGRHFNGSQYFSGNIDEFHLYSRVLSGEEISALFYGPGYGEWASGNGLSEGPYGDDDQDGLLNLYEYGLGGDPANAASRGLAPQASVTKDRGTNWFCYVYSVLSAVDNGLFYSLELTDDLASGVWTNGGYIVAGTNAPGGAFNYVSNRVSAVDDDQKFIRLVIEQQ